MADKDFLAALLNRTASTETRAERVLVDYIAKLEALASSGKAMAELMTAVQETVGIHSEAGCTHAPLDRPGQQVCNLCIKARAAGLIPRADKG